MSTSSSSDELDSNLMLPETSNTPKIINENLLPSKSKQRYIATYDSFVQWKINKKANTFSEDVFLAYFGELAEKYKPSSLWAIYSMLKTTLMTKHSVNIKNYANLMAFLRKKSDGFISKKSKVLSAEHVEKFLNDAPDAKYLATKVALIFGIAGSCRRQELADITVNDIEQHNEMLLIKIPKTKNKIPRSFTIQGKFYKIVKKYESLRSKRGTSNRFFQHFQNGKCTSQLIGKNKFGSMPKEIAEYLNLSDAKLYTGHSYRRTATLLADSGVDIMGLNWHGGCKSSNHAEGYVEASIDNKSIDIQISDSILRSSENVDSMPQPSTPYTSEELFPLPSSKSSNLAEGYVEASIDNKNIDIQISDSILRSTEKVESMSRPSTPCTGEQLFPLPSTSFPKVEIEPQKSPLSESHPTQSDTNTLHSAELNVNNNLTQTIKLPGKNVTLNLTNCNVTLNFSH